MKKLYYFLFILIVSTACSRDGDPGPQGIPGPPGLDGLDGLDGETAYVFEYEFSFNPDNGYTEIIAYPNGFTLYPEEVVLVYLLWENNEEVGDIWRLMPQSSMMQFGWLQYNYDFTRKDVSIFLEADFPLENLGPIYTEGWVRVVVIPAQDISNAKQLNTVDYNDYDAVKETYNLPDLPLPEENKPGKRF